jgi:hypothetical protein
MVINENRDPVRRASDGWQGREKEYEEDPD